MKPSDPSSDPTVAAEPTDTEATHHRFSTEPTGEQPRAVVPIESYALGDVIGRGGMGEVVLAHDREIGRDVAIKRLRTEDPTAEALDRFMREARIQARLDHPAIVPVYELGHDSAGRPYFTMKRLAGVTLAEVLAARSLPRQRLLRAFADVCLAVEFAHARDIVHRDLKPANIMLGDYGEVYVLDWGLARTLDGELERPGEGRPREFGTQAGAMLGTPGYMAPEQIEDAAAVGRPADVYALGAILFEILAGEPLHPRGDAIASTLAATDGSPARRRPNSAVPPELDALCSAALATDPTVRPTADELAERVQRYLDGDRDLERRRTLAVEQLAHARTTLVEGQRAEAMRAAGRALALDPELAAAAELVTALMLEPPATPPPELQEVLRASDASTVGRHARESAHAFFAIALLAPAVIWNGVLSWRLIGAIVAATLVLTIAALRIARSPDRSFREMFAYVLGVSVLLVALGRLCGPFLFVPAIASFIALSVTSFPVFVGRAWLVIGCAVAGWVVPLVLEQLGIFASTWSLHDGAFVITSNAIRLEGGSTIALAVILSIATIVIAGLHGGRRATAYQSARRQLVTQAWHLRQLLPAKP